MPTLPRVVVDEVTDYEGLMACLGLDLAVDLVNSIIEDGNQRIGGSHFEPLVPNIPFVWPNVKLLR